MRYFGQTKDYWLDNCTLQEWREVWQRELTELPPPEAFLAEYFEFEPRTSAEIDPDEGQEVTFDVSECES